MRQLARIIAVSVVTLGLAGCIQNAKDEAESAGAKVLGAAEVKTAYAGNTLAGGLPDLEKMRRGLETEPQTLTVFFAEDGRLSAVAKSKLGVDRDRGTWRTTDAGELCMKWQKLQPEENCFPIHAQGSEHKIFAKEGGLRAAYTMESGNSGKLSIKTTKEEIVDSGAKPLTAEQATAQLTGNTVNGRMPKEATGFVYFLAEDGKASGRQRSAGGEKLDAGSWRVGDKGELCIKWTQWGKGEERCEVVYAKGKRNVIFDDEGDVAAAFKIAKGNSEKLSLPDGS